MNAMKTNRLLLSLIGASIAIVVCGVVAMAMLASRRNAPPFQPESIELQAAASRNHEEELPVLWDAPQFSYTDQAGKTLTQADLRGHVWVADFIFTQCTAICPTMTAKMVLLQRQVADPDVRFISFSVDPEHDTVDALAAYAKLWNADESRWHLLRTSDQAIKATAEGLKVMVAPSGDPGNPIMHSNYFFLVDAQGRVRGVYNSGDRETMDRLAQHAQLLAAETGARAAAPQVAAVGDGKAIYAALGCAACHNNVQLGPPLEHLFGREIKLDDGRTIVADEPYVRAAILDPAAQVVAGYRKTMPSYEGHLNDQQAQRLIDYLRTLSPAGSTAAPGADVKLVTDPVCKMRITVDANALHVDLDGATHYFCSASCLEKFKANPAMYLAAPATQPAQ
jgi:protein SCO1/2